MTVLLLAFLSGFIVDIFEYSYGMHTAAATFIGFLRPYLLRAVITENDDELQLEPHLQLLGFRRFFVYTFIMIFMHHFVLYFLESMTLHNFSWLIVKILINTLFSALVIFVYELLVFFRRI